MEEEIYDYVVSPTLPDGTLGETLRIKKEKRQEALNAGYTIATPEQASVWKQKRAERVKVKGEPKPEEVRVFGGGTMTLPQPEAPEQEVDGLPTVRRDDGEVMPYDPVMVDKIIKGNPAISQDEAKKRAAQAYAFMQQGVGTVEVDKRALAVEEAGKGLVVPTLTGIEQLAGTLTFGGTEFLEDLVGRAFDIETLKASQQAIREEANPTISQVADVVGIVGPMIGTMGASLLPQAAARGATTVGGRVLGATLRGAAATDIAGRVARKMLGKTLGTGGAAAARAAATAELDTALAAGTREAQAAIAGTPAITDYILMPVKAAKGARGLAIETRRVALENAAIAERLKTMGFKEAAAVGATAATIGAATAGLSAGTRAALAESRINPDNIGETIGAQFWTNAAEGAPMGALTAVGLTTVAPPLIKGVGTLIDKLRGSTIKVNELVLPVTSQLLTEATPEQQRKALATIIPANDARFQERVNVLVDDMNGVYANADNYAGALANRADRLMAEQVAAGVADPATQNSFSNVLAEGLNRVNAASRAVREKWGRDASKLDPNKVRDYFKSDKSLRITYTPAGEMDSVGVGVMPEMEELTNSLAALEEILRTGAGEIPRQGATGVARVSRPLRREPVPFTPPTNVFMPQEAPFPTPTRGLPRVETTEGRLGVRTLPLAAEGVFSRETGELAGQAFRPLTAGREAAGVLTSATAGGVAGAVAGGALETAAGAVGGGLLAEAAAMYFFDPSIAIRNLRSLDAVQKATADALKGTAQGLFRKPVGTITRTAGAREFIAQQELGKVPKQQDADTLYKQDKALLEKLGTIEGIDAVFGKGYETLNEQTPVAAAPTELTIPRQVAFLNEKMPRPVGREPTSKEIYEYGMYARYVRNPLQIRQDIATKGYIPPQAIEVLESVYPSLVQGLRQEVMDFYLEQQSIPLNKRFFLDATGRRTMNKIMGMDITGMTPADIEKNKEALMTKPSRYKTSGSVQSPQQNLTPSQKAVSKP